MKSRYSPRGKSLHYRNGKVIKILPTESRSQYWERCRKLGAKEFK